MSQQSVEQVIDEVRRWSPADRIELVRRLNHLTARERLAAIGDKVHRRAQQHPLTDAEIDRAVHEVRRERPLHRRSST